MHLNAFHKVLNKVFSGQHWAFCNAMLKFFEFERFGVSLTVFP